LVVGGTRKKKKTENNGQKLCFPPELVLDLSATRVVYLSTFGIEIAKKV
jgi:hypothetical protein